MVDHFAEAAQAIVLEVTPVHVSRLPRKLAAPVLPVVLKFALASAAAVTRTTTRLCSYARHFLWLLPLFFSLFLSTCEVCFEATWYLDPLAKSNTPLPWMALSLKYPSNRDPDCHTYTPRPHFLSCWNWPANALPEAAYLVRKGQAN